MPDQSDQERDRPSPGVAVVVPAAGQGTRLGGRRKQFRRLGGRPLLAQTLLVFERCAAVDALVVAGPPGEAAALERRLRAEGLEKLHAVVEGSASRQASVAAALAVVPEASSVVLVHDAVRPFIEEKRVEAVIEAVRAEGAAALAVPVADTLRRVADGTFGATAPRETLYRMQTPQGFRRAWLAEAHTAARSGPPATDDVELVQRVGYAVRLVEGDAHNFKITTPEDWLLARRLWPRWEETIGERAS